MKFVESVGKTKEEALEKALQELQTTIDKVKVEYDEQKSGGLFGFLAKKEIRVKVTLLDEESFVENSFIETENTSEDSKNDYEEADFTVQVERARVFLTEVFESIGIQDIEIKITMNDDTMAIEVFGEEASKLIGRRGDSLDALQMLTSLAVNKGELKYARVILDIENYREKREESLRKYAQKMARQATKQRRIVRLEPMNPYERRIIHSSLQDDRYVKTYSEGKDPYRKVVIEPKYK